MLLPRLWAIEAVLKSANVMLMIPRHIQTEANLKTDVATVFDIRVLLIASNTYINHIPPCVVITSRILRSSHGVNRLIDIRQCISHTYMPPETSRFSRDIYCWHLSHLKARI